MKRYDKHFKEEAVRLVVELGRSVATVAKAYPHWEKACHSECCSLFFHKVADK